MADRNQILGPEKGYIEMLDEVLVAEDLKEQQRLRREKNPLRPSSAGECARKLAYQFREHLGLEEVVVEERDGAQIRLLDLGHWIESHILKHFRRVPGLNADVYKQQVVGVVEYDDGTFTEGSIDMGLRTEGGHFGIGDAKSKGDRFSSYRSSKWDENAGIYAKFQSVTRFSDTFFWIEDLDLFLSELKDPYFAANFLQLNSYIHSDFLTRRKANHGTIIQYNKNDSRMREFRFRPSPKAYNYVVTKFQGVKANAADNLEAVPKEFGLGSNKCAYCPYSQRCWPQLDTKKEYYKTLPPKEWPRDTGYLGDVGRRLEELYENYKEAAEVSDMALDLEEQICNLLDEKQVTKVRFGDGEIYEVKFLKSPKPHLELRRSKL